MSAITEVDIERAGGLLVRQFKKFDRSPRTFVHMGDSRVQGMYLDGAKRNKSTNNQWNQANRILGNRMVVLGNFGVAGQTSIQQLAYIDQAVAVNAGNFSIQVGVNDFTANIATGNPLYPGDALTTTWGAVLYMCERARNAGMRVWLWLDPGSSNQTAAQIGLRNDFNQKCREYAELTPNVVLVDLPSWVLNPVSGTAVVWKTDAAGNVVSTDGTHLTTVGGIFAGGFLAALVAQVIPPLQHTPVDTLAIFGNGSSILTPNPMFKVLTGGGSVGTGNTGTLPGSASGSRIGGSSAVFSTATNADGFGNDLVMAVTNTGSVANDRVRFSMNLNTAAMSGGQWLEVGMEIDVAAGAGGLQSVTLGTNFSYNAVQYFNNDAISDATRLEDKGGYTKLQLKTDPLFIPGPVSATPSFFLTAFALPGVAGTTTATITARKPWARLRSAGTYPP